MSFVITPLGVLMHVDNHAACVAIARQRGLKNWQTMLEPAQPVDEKEFFGDIDHAIRTLQGRGTEPSGGAKPTP